MPQTPIPKFDDWVQGQQFAPLDNLKSFASQQGLEVGSTTGGRHNRGSKHYQARAIDIRNSGNLDDARVQELASTAAAQGLKLRDERRRPKGQAVWGGPHIHLETADTPAQIPRFDDWVQSQPSEQSTPRKSAKRVSTLPSATAAPSITDALDEIARSTTLATEKLKGQASQQPNKLFQQLGQQRTIDQSQRDQERQIRDEVVKERASRVGAYGAPTPSGMLHLIANPVDSLTGLFRSEDENVNREVQERLKQQQIASEPEVTAIRKEYGQMPAAVRSVAAPLLGRGGGGLLKTAGGIASLFGIAPNRLSEWANKRGEIVEAGSTLTPLREKRDLSSLITGDKELEEVERGIPEKITTGVADLGVGIAQVLLLKKATKLPFNQLLALEAAARNSDKPIDQQMSKAAEGYAMGSALESHLSRGANAALFGIPTAAQTGYEVSQGRMSPLDAAIQTSIQAGAGALLTPSKKSSLERGLAREAPRQPVGPDAEIAVRLRGEQRGTQAKVQPPVEARQQVSDTLPTSEVVQRSAKETIPEIMQETGMTRDEAVAEHSRQVNDLRRRISESLRDGRYRAPDGIIYDVSTHPVTSERSIRQVGTSANGIEYLGGEAPDLTYLAGAERVKESPYEPQIQTKPLVEAQRKQLSEQESASLNTVRQHLSLVSDRVDDLGKRYITYDLKLPGKEPVRVVIASESSAMRHVEVGMGSIRPDTSLPNYTSPRVDLGTRRALALKRVLQQLHPEIESIEFHRVGSTGGEQERHRVLKLQGQPPVEAQRAEVAETVPEIRADVSTADVQAEQPSQRFFHRDYGEVTESPNQKQVGKNRVRVIDENGREHVIKRAAMTGAGNQRAVPIRESQPIEQKAETESRPITQVEGESEFAIENRAALAPHLKPVRQFWRELGFIEGREVEVVDTKQRAIVLGEGIVPDRIAIQFSDGNIADLKPTEIKVLLPKNVGEVADVSSASSATSPWEVPKESLSAKSVTEPVTERRSQPIDTLTETEGRPATSIKNVATEELRADLDLTDIARPEKRAWQTSIDNAQAKGLDKQVDQIADKVINGSREVALDLEESAALLIKTRELENQWEQTYRSNPDDPRLAQIKSQLDKYSAAADMGGTETARTLNFRRAMVDKEFRLISLIRQAEKAKGREVTPVEVARYEQIVKERDAAIAQRDAALEQARAADLQRQINREGRKTRRTEQKKTLDDEAVVIRQNIANEIARIKTQSVQPSGLAALDPEGKITKEILKYARNRIKANIGLKAEALIDEVHDLVKGLGATRQQVAETLARGRQRQQQRDEVTRRLAEVRREIASMVNEADVAAGRRSPRQEGPKRDYQRNQQRLKQLEKREAEYERRIREHDFEPKEKKEFPYSPEVRAAERRVEIAEAKFYKEMKRAEGGHQLRNLSGIYKAWLLSSPLTHVKNITGTQAYQVFSEGARLPSVIADAALSTVTKQRGISGPSPSAMLESVSNAIRVGGREAIDIMRQGATKEQMERHQYQEIDFGVNTGKPAIDKGVKIIELAHNAIFRFMSASDRVAYQFALKRNLIDRANIQAHNEGLSGEARRTRVKELTEHPPEQLEADAKHDALVNTFNNNNALSTKIKAARAATIKNPNLSRKAAQRINAAENLALDLVLPFDRTPTNVVMRILEASPAGYLKNAGQLVKTAINKSMTVEDQRQFAQTFGKATAGTALIALGWKLADELFDVDDKGIVSLKLGSRRIKLDYISPLGNLIATGVRLRKAHNEEKGMTEDAKIIGREVSNIPVLRATSGLSEMLQDPARSIPKTGARYAFGAVPFSGAVRFASDVLDPKERDAKGFKQQFQRNVPIWRQQLPEHVDRKRQRADLGEDVRAGRRSAGELEQMVREGQITEARKQQILRDAKVSATQARFNDYLPSTALDRYERKSAAQREEVREIMEKKAWPLTHSDTLTDAQKADFQERLDKLGIIPREPKKSSGSFKDLFRQSASPF